MNPFATIEGSGQSVAVSGTGATVTAISAVPGKRIIIYHLVLYSDATTTINFDSGTTAITGNFAMTSSNQLELKNAGVPVLMGRALGDAINIDSSNSAANLTGYAVIAYAQNEGR